MTTLPDMGLLQPGFPAPSRDSQEAFRCLLSAMSRPGSAYDLPVRLAPQSDLGPAAAAICLTLLDFETPVWFDVAASVPETGSYLRFHCGCPLVSDTASAAFALILAPAALPPLTGFALGSEAYPDRSTTLIFQVESLEGGMPVALSGPGIPEVQHFAPAGILPAIWEQRRDLERLFPQGLDMIFASASTIAALPRTSRVEF